MMFLLKCAFWLGLVFLVAPMIFPPDTRPAAVAPAAVATAPAARTPAATPAAEAASPLAQAGRVLEFCRNNPAVCETAIGAVSALGTMVGDSIDFFTGLVSSRPARSARLPADPALTGTLTASDREEPWHGVAPAPRPPQG
ncbi:hypothetical protein [Pseudoxanthobacter sp.]|uniref:hypothetical protein n=1 Tax=Pseudoxanthobacter sp. TaxID=1925742 RepID=UPI002FE1F378